MVNCLVVVGVAQLVERRSVAPNVAGSIPVSHPSLPTVFIAFRCAYARHVRLDDLVCQTRKGSSYPSAVSSVASFDSTDGAGIGKERRQIIEFGEDGSYSAGQCLLFGVDTVVGCQQKDRQLRFRCPKLLSQL